MRAFGQLIAAVAVVSTGGALLAGCGGDKNTQSAAAPVVRAVSTTRTPGAFPGISGKGVLKDAVDAMESTPTMTVDLHTTGDDDEPIHMKAAVTDTGKCAATVEDDGDRFQLIGTGEQYYMKADETYWQDKGGADGDALSAFAAGKWLKLPRDAGAQAGFKQFCDLKTLLGSMADAGSEGTVTKGRVLTYAGEQVQSLTQHADDGDTEMYVAVNGTPYLLRAFTPDDDSNTATFSGFGRATRITAPPAGLTVDISAFGGDPGFSV
ncbi:hypothetical protein OG552_24055 [Streptomyces sp. NBC_01476]|uniref:hypothetical protein n=1 Tax=Streptomyces sp. NBC_01476 TaxID=2903881 RepID=UPI002E2F299B|nr:hypothetical protein [Streptomyces sp. NBC_01476]